MSSCFGRYFRLSLFGQSHGPGVGVTLDGFPAGLEIDMEDAARQMARRAPGQSALTTPRKESDLRVSRQNHRPAPYLPDSQ